MPSLQANEIMAFVPSGKDYPLAIEFYTDLGFSIDYRSDELTVMRKDKCRFYHQNFALEQMQKNFMMNLDVEDLDAWWAQIQSAGLGEKYPGTRFVAPKDYPWGKREIHMIDPAGVLWHIAVRV